MSLKALLEIILSIAAAGLDPCNNLPLAAQLLLIKSTSDNPILSPGATGPALKVAIAAYKAVAFSTVVGPQIFPGYSDFVQKTSLNGTNPKAYAKILLTPNFH